jgi:hypothetical protein
LSELEPEPEDDVPVEEEYPDSRKRVRVPEYGGHSVIAASFETRHELASRRESMKSGFGTGILILRPDFPFPFSLEVSSDMP